MSNMIYTYSPNWYRPQCLFFYDSSLFYSSNYLLYEFDLKQKKVTREICFRKVALNHALNYRDIKINAIACNEKNLFIAINQAYIFVVHKLTFEIQQIVSLIDFTAAQSLYLYQSTIILSNSQGKLAKYQKNQQIKIFFQPKQKIGQLKALYRFQKYIMTFNSKGLISIFSQEQVTLIQSIQLGETILSVDMVGFTCCMLTRNKQKTFIRVFQFDLQHIGLLNLKQKLISISKDIKFFQISIEYPKKYFQKLKQSQKASLTIKFLSNQEMIITGKLGEIVSIYLEQIQQKAHLLLKPYSSEQRSKKYNIWPDSHHFKDIYAIYQHQNQLFCIGTDHRLTTWTYIQKQFKMLYSIKFFTSAVSSFFFPEHDPTTIFMLLKDSVIRECSPLQEGGHFLNEYWKYIKKFIIKKVLCHPTEEGVMVMQTNCNRVLIFDIYEDRLMKVIQINDQIITISFENNTIRPILQKINLSKIEPVKLLFASSFLKQMTDEFDLFIQCKNNFYFTDGIAQKQLMFYKIAKKIKNERIHNNHYWDDEILLSTQCKQNIIRLFVSLKEKILEAQHSLKYQNSRFMFKYPQKSHKLYLINYKSKEIHLSQYKITDKLQFVRSKQCSLQKFIDMIQISYTDDRIICFNKRDEQIQMLKIDQCLKGEFSLQIYQLGAQIECLTLFKEQWLIFASKDQSMKVVQISTLKQV